MPLSTVLGAQSLVQPAVCTTATRPASPYTGQAIYDTTTSSLLIWNGSAWTGTGGMPLVTTATCSSGGTAVGGVVTIGSAVSSVTVANAFSSTYDNYKITINGTAHSASGNTFTMTLNGSAGSTYSGALVYINSVNTNIVSSQLDNSTSAYVGITNTTQNGITLDILGPNLAKATPITGTNTGYTTSGTSRGSSFYFTDGNAASSTAFTLSSSTGTMTGGTIRVYGYQNS